MAQWLDICGRNGITLNPEKFIFVQDVVEFAGFEITHDTVRPCKRFLRAITEFPTPKNITDIRSWFGLLNQVSYAFSIAERMLPFRNLLKPAALFHWDDNLDRLFEESKTVIATEIANGVIKLNQPALRQTGPETALAFGFFKSIVCVHQPTSFVADMDGKSPWWVVDLPTPRNPGTHLLRERLLLWQTLLIRQDTLFWDVPT